MNKLKGEIAFNHSSTGLSNVNINLTLRIISVNINYRPLGMIMIGLLSTFYLFAIVAMFNMDSAKKAALFLSALILLTGVIYIFVHFPGHSATVVTIIGVGTLLLNTLRSKGTFAQK